MLSAGTLAQAGASSGNHFSLLGASAETRRLFSLVAANMSASYFQGGVYLSFIILLRRAVLSSRFLWSNNTLRICNLVEILENLSSSLHGYSCLIMI